MRHVPYDPTNINYSDRWHEKADAARRSIQNALPEERAREINKHRSLWADLKSELAKIMHGKCWYTEAPQRGTDTDVDHFRPKSSVKDVFNSSTHEKHPGYWWLAIDPANFRFSCIVANRKRRDLATGILGGKADEFPIFDENNRAWTPNDDCGREQSLLIDPCNPVEVTFITFGENGEAIPRYNDSDKPRFFKKAKCSIKLYHLNHDDFVKARIEIREDLRKNIEDAKRYYARLDSAGVDIEHAYMRAIENLREACSYKSPFSSFAIALLAPLQFEDSLVPVFHK